MKLFFYLLIIFLLLKLSAIECINIQFKRVNAIPPHNIAQATIGVGLNVLPDTLEGRPRQTEGIYHPLWGYENGVEKRTPLNDIFYNNLKWKVNEPMKLQGNFEPITRQGVTNPMQKSQGQTPPQVGQLAEWPPKAMHVLRNCSPACDQKEGVRAGKRD